MSTPPLEVQKLVVKKILEELQKNYLITSTNTWKRIRMEISTHLDSEKSNLYEWKSLFNYFKRKLIYDIESKPSLYGITNAELRQIHYQFLYKIYHIVVKFNESVHFTSMSPDTLNVHLALIQYELKKAYSNQIYETISGKNPSRKRMVFNINLNNPIYKLSVIAKNRIKARRKINSDIPKIRQRPIATGWLSKQQSTRNSPPIDMFVSNSTSSLSESDESNAADINSNNNNVDENMKKLGTTNLNADKPSGDNLDITNLIIDDNNKLPVSASSQHSTASKDSSLGYPTPNKQDPINARISNSCKSTDNGITNTTNVNSNKLSENSLKVPEISSVGNLSRLSAELAPDNSLNNIVPWKPIDEQNVINASVELNNNVTSNLSNCTDSTEIREKNLSNCDVSDHNCNNQSMNSTNLKNETVLHISGLKKDMTNLIKKHEENCIKLMKRKTGKECTPEVVPCPLNEIRDNCIREISRGLKVNRIAPQHEHKTPHQVTPEQGDKEADVTVTVKNIQKESDNHQNVNVNIETEHTSYNIESNRSIGIQDENPLDCNADDHVRRNAATSAKIIQKSCSNQTKDNLVNRFDGVGNKSCIVVNKPTNFVLPKMDMYELTRNCIMKIGEELRASSAVNKENYNNMNSADVIASTSVPPHTALNDNERREGASENHIEPNVNKSQEIVNDNSNKAVISSNLNENYHDVNSADVIASLSAVHTTINDNARIEAVSENLIQSNIHKSNRTETSSNLMDNGSDELVEDTDEEVEFLPKIDMYELTKYCIKKIAQDLRDELQAQGSQLSSQFLNDLHERQESMRTNANDIDQISLSTQTQRLFGIPESQQFHSINNVYPVQSESIPAIYSESLFKDVEQSTQNTNQGGEIG